MSRRKSRASVAAFKTTPASPSLPCGLSMSDAPPDFAPTPALPSPAIPASAPRRHFRTPKRCTMGFQYYDERHGERVLARPVPKLRLTGRWLEQCGFAVGDELQVTVGNGVLLLSRRNDKR